MKTLILMRHAESSWPANNDNDFERPLSKLGENSIEIMSEALLTKNINLELMVCSTAVRAAKTAAKLADRLQYRRKQVTLLDELYLAKPADIWQIIKNFDNQNNTVMLVGHNPGLTALASYITGEYVSNLPVCGVYEIQIDLDNWQDICPGYGRCLFFDYPDKYNA